MHTSRERDEHLEQLWYMKEEGATALTALKTTMDSSYDLAIIDQLVSQHLVELDQDRDTISLTDQGQSHTEKLIRAHRLAERLLHDVLGGDYESGACEFEHTVTPELVDSICILLGHPRSCPHGLAIPQGPCCIRSARTAHSSVVPLVELEVGQSARVAHINSKNDQQLHRIDNLHIRPGAEVTLHQRYPSYVIECEGSNIAMDEAIVAQIGVWREPTDPQQTPPDQSDHKRRRRRFRNKGKTRP